MSRRLLLTLIWLAFFFLVVLDIELFYWAYPEGRKMIESERPDIYKPVLTVYGAYTAAILAAWFIKPFPKLSLDRGHDGARFSIAVVCTLMFNVLVLYFVSLPHWQEASVFDSVHRAMTLAGYFSILVAPVNLYYFGVRSGDAENGAA